MSTAEAAAELRRSQTSQFASVLFRVPECRDSSEPGRACRWCEADYLVKWLMGEVQ